MILFCLLLLFCLLCCLEFCSILFGYVSGLPDAGADAGPGRAGVGDGPRDRLSVGPEVPLPLLLALLPPDWGGMRGAVLASSLPSLGWGGMSGAVLA